MAEHFFYFGTKMGRNSPKTSRMWDAGNSRIEGQFSDEEIVRANLKTNMINIQEDSREMCQPLKGTNCICKVLLVPP